MKFIMGLFENLVKDICGNNGVRILKSLEGKENVSEFDLADDLDMNINELRTLLYKLTEHNLITSTRKKDKEKGWYIYYWTFNFIHARDLLIKEKEKKLLEISNKLGNREVPKYICPHSCVSMDIESAMEIEFKCPECSSLLKLREVKYDEEVLKKKAKEIEEDLEKIRQAVVVKVAQKEEVEKKEVRKPSRKKKEVRKKPAKKKQKKRNPIKKKKVKKKSKKKPAKTVKKKDVKQKKKNSSLISKIKKRIRF